MNDRSKALHQGVGSSDIGAFADSLAESLDRQMKVSFQPEDRKALRRFSSTEVAELLRTIATPTRLLLLCQIAQGEPSVADLERDLGLRQPGLSQQLAELRRFDLVKTRRESRSIHYSIADPRVRTAYMGTEA